jgi:CcmD family protein
MMSTETKTSIAMTTMTIMMNAITKRPRISLRARPHQLLAVRPALAAVMLIVGLLAPASPITTTVSARQPAAAAQAPQAPQPPAATDQFVPMDEIPEQDKLPAAPYLIGAYAVAWLALLFYVWSLWRRLGRVEEELKRLAPGGASER